ncbi:MAG: pseudouridine synthase [Gemmatimonadota bacterium]
MSRVRLQKFLANAGVASRRKAEELIEAGRVSVNGQVVTELGTKVDPATDAITVDGRNIESAQPVWVALHKPRGYVSTRDDPQGRPTIYDLLPESLHSLFYVGRLDVDSEGLMLLTNAGDQAHRLLHPSFGVSRVYEVLVKGDVARETVERLLRGVELEDGVARAESVERLPASKVGASRLRLILREGRKREVRRMLSAVGRPVRRLRRTRYGPIELGNLPSGKWRLLSEAEQLRLR